MSIKKGKLNAKHKDQSTTCAYFFIKAISSVNYYGVSLHCPLNPDSARKHMYIDCIESEYKDMNREPTNNAIKMLSVIMSAKLSCVSSFKLCFMMI